MTRKRRGGIKRGESNLASNQFPMCSPESGTLREVHGVTKRRDEGGRRKRWPGGERGVKRRETSLANSQLPKCSPQPRTPKKIHRVG